MARRLRELLLWAGAALGLLAVVAGVAVTFLGFSFLVFRSGSMEPDIATGGLALSRTVQAEDIRAGDVVSVVAGNGDRITHRVVSSTLRGDEASLVLQGDANAAPDTEIYVVRSAERVVASVPYGGYVIAHALTPPGIVAAACLSLMLLVVGFARDDDDVDPDDGGDPDDEDAGGGDPHVDVRQPGGRHLAGTGRPTWTARAAAGVAVVAVGVLALTGTSGTLAAFTDNATATTSSSANKYFTCDASSRGLTGSPFLYWKLDELTGVTNAADSSGNNRTGVYQSLTGISYTATRACGRDGGTAVTLNGSSGYVGGHPTAVAGPNTFTVALWFRTTTTRGGKLIGFGNVRTGQSAQYDRHVYLGNDGRLNFGVYPGAVRVVTSPQAYNDGRWHHVVATLSAAGMRLYVDGGLVASRADTTAGESFNGFWRVGYDNVTTWTNQPTSPYFAGSIDEVAVYTTAASPDDVDDAHQAGRPNP